LYFKNGLDVRALMYGPYYFTDVESIILGITITPYSASVLLFSVMTMIIGYISYKWFYLLCLIAYMTLIIVHKTVSAPDFEGRNIVFGLRILVFFLWLVSIFIQGRGVQDLNPTGQAVWKIHGNNVLKHIMSPRPLAAMLMMLVISIVEYNYKPGEGEYTVPIDTKNYNEKYISIYKSPWIFSITLIPIFFMLFAILRSRFNLTNTFILSASIITVFTLLSFILY
tara:strand:+ start:2484 stop:3158 length:675 start_codon:yes stop_codon:yes gene_type:complete